MKLLNERAARAAVELLDKRREVVDALGKIDRRYCVIGAVHLDVPEAVVRDLLIERRERIDAELAELGVAPGK